MKIIPKIVIMTILCLSFLVFRYLKEYDAEARFEGDLFVLTFAKGF